MELYWIGGSVCASKSTVSKTLARDWGAVVYDYDATERDHLERLGRADRILDRIEDDDARRSAHDERWLSRPPADMAQRTHRSWTERFPLVLEDVEGIAGERVVAHGSGLFPELVHPHLEDQRRGVWLVATPEFLRWARRRRGMTAPGLTSDPEAAWENIISRDHLMADKIRDVASDLGLATITVDGSEPAEAIANTVAEHFGWPRPA